MPMRGKKSNEHRNSTENSNPNYSTAWHDATLRTPNRIRYMVFNKKVINKDDKQGLALLDLPFFSPVRSFECVIFRCSFLFVAPHASVLLLLLFWLLFFFLLLNLLTAIVSIGATPLLLCLLRNQECNAYLSLFAALNFYCDWLSMISLDIAAFVYTKQNS